VSMLDALGEWMSQPSLFTLYGGQPPRRSGARHASIAPYGPYHTGDGATVFLGIQNEREWVAFCAHVLATPELAGDSRFATNTRRVAHDRELTELIEARFRELDADQVVSMLDGLDIANARLRTMAEFNDHPQLAARQRWREVDSPGGPVRSLLPP